MTTTSRDELILAARQVRERAYAPYSGFRVGAAVLSSSGQIIVGCNVENASYGMTICAERAAVCSAVASGTTKFREMVLSSVGGVAPCGACRQMLAEFSPDLTIVLDDVDGSLAVREVRLRDLLPETFVLPGNE